MAAAGIGCLPSWSNKIHGLTCEQLLIRPPNGPVHNMLILGTNTPIFYHLPMFSFKGFDSPHRYQIILEADFGDFQDVYARARAEDRRESRKNLYTFSPEQFVLTDLNRRTAPLTKLTGTVFRGHLEKGGTVFRENVKAEVSKIYFREFNSKANRPSQLEYILFEKGQELFLAHVVTKPPDFDQILSIKDIGGLSGEEIYKVQVKPFREVVFPVKNSVLERIKTGQQIKGQLRPVGAERFQKRRLFVNFKVEEEIYLEEGELRAPPEFAATPAERAAGFP